jgi:hypothetical protein
VTISGRIVKSTTAHPLLQKLRIGVILRLSPFGVHALEEAITQNRGFFNICSVMYYCESYLSAEARCWWRSWLRHCATNRKVVGSISDGVNGIFH